MERDKGVLTSSPPHSVPFLTNFPAEPQTLFFLFLLPLLGQEPFPRPNSQRRGETPATRGAANHIHELPAN